MNIAKFFGTPILQNNSVLLLCIVGLYDLALNLKDSIFYPFLLLARYHAAYVSLWDIPIYKTLENTLLFPNNYLLRFL